jgi:hypothetical protein
MPLSVDPPEFMFPEFLDVCQYGHEECSDQPHGACTHPDVWWLEYQYTLAMVERTP